MSAPTKPLPRIDADSAPFWEAAAEGRLVGQRCGSCDSWRWPPREHCPECHAA
ncbi:Zn-ribbon domain-containing OB-fold protein, partial [Postechiella marina]